jgi:YegS C-terminal NAD kinase beta sandwich-like domain
VTIRKGESWGAPAARPADLVLAGSDAELAQLVARDAGGAYGLGGGDLHRSLGAPPPREPMQRLPMDALRVRLDGDEWLAVAHVVARDGWWRGPLLGVLNCAYVGDWNAAPRAHPNDGRFDVVEVSAAMSVRQRLQARRRLALGTHVPHPQIAVRTAESAVWSFGAPRDVYVDGVRRGRATRLEIAISPDHFSIHT